MSTLMHKLRPAKVSSAIRRRWFERQVPRGLGIDGSVPVEELGTSYGGWMVPLDLIEPDWTCYCVGVGADISFDLELIRRTGARVRAFDPVSEFVDGAQAAAAGESRFSAHQVAIASKDGPLRMQVTHDPKSESVSSAGLYDSASFVEFPGRTLPSLMAEYGDPWLDLLKLDIEGAEYELLPTVDLREIGVKVFATQLHHNGSVRDARRLIDGLHTQGYVPVACRYAVKLTFVRRDLI